MSIQQAFNNMLMSAQVATGFYAHSPEGKKRAEVRQTKKAIRAAEGKADIAAAALEADEGIAFEKEYTFRTKDIANLKQHLFELTPTEKSYQSYLKAVKEKEFAKELYKDRKKFLKEKGGKK